MKMPKSQNNGHKYSLNPNAQKCIIYNTKGKFNHKKLVYLATIITESGCNDDRLFTQLTAKSRVMNIKEFKLLNSDIKIDG